MTRLLILLALSLTGCGLLRDSEPAPSTMKLEKRKPECELPNWKTLSRAETATTLVLGATLDCVQRQVDGAFRQLRGKTEGELSLPEIRTLYRHGFFDLPLDTEAAWSALEEGLSLLHPEGRPALSHKVITAFLEWGRRRVPQYVQTLGVMRDDRGEALYDSLATEKTLVALEELASLISPNWRLSLGRARTLVEVASRDVARLDTAVKNQIEAAWILKSLALPDEAGQGPRADIDGKGVRRLIQLAIDLVRAAPAMRFWAGNSHGNPGVLPQEFPSEAKRIGKRLAAYFSENQFATIDARLLAWAISQFEGQSASADLAPDLVRISQRLTPEGDRRDGLHPVAFLSLLAETGPIAADIADGAKAFGMCKDSWNCTIPVRDAMKSPALSRVALKGQLETWRIESSTAPVPTQRRLDYPFSWESFVARTARRHLVTRVFSTFDKDGDGIPLRGVTEEDLEEPLDLSFTFLRLIAFGQSAPVDPKKKEQSVPTFVAVKPGALYRVMGLLGDRWIPGGNGDDILNGDEFFAVMQVYDEIQQIANSALWSMGVTRYGRPSDLDSAGYLRDYRRSVFRRKEFVQKIHNTYQRELPLSFLLLQTMDSTRRESFMHGLIGVSAQRPLPARRLDSNQGNDPNETLSQYVTSEAALAPTAILVAMDKLMIRCDLNEDEQLDWHEMNCAVPLLLDAGLQTVQSSLIDLDPIVYDGARLLLTFLQTPGIPLSLAKLAMANGSLRSFELASELTKLEEWVDSSLSADWDGLARLIGAPQDPISKNQFNIWKQEARRRFGKCDRAPRDGKLKGKEELDCFADEAMRQVAKLAEDFAPDGVAKAGLDRFFEMREAQAFRLGLKISTQSDSDLEKLFTFAPVRTNPRKILLLLEEILRRSVPLWQMPD